LVATSHYGEDKDYAEKKEGFKNGKMIFDIESLKPTYNLEIGAAGESNAFIIALRLGMDQRVIERAHTITYDERKDYTAMNVKKASNKPPENYRKAKRPTSIKRQIEKQHKVEMPEVTYRVGDAVFVHTLQKRGIVFEEETKKQEVGVMIRDKKIYVQKKRLSMFIEREKLYPDVENYDMDIVTETVDYRKKNKQMGRKFQKDMEIVYKEGTTRDE
jgi:dsDNA-specific endonuclease/ATPase MutS2